MKIRKQNLKIAKLIYSLVLVNGVVDREKLTKALLVVKNYPISTKRQILSTLLKLLEKAERSKTLLVESAFLLDNEITNEIQAKFEKLLGKKLEIRTRENKALISGIKVTSGDNIWENTVGSNLKELKGKFISR